MDDNAEQLRRAAAAGQIGTWEWNPVSGAQTLSSSSCGSSVSKQAYNLEISRKWAARVWPDDWPKVQLLMQQGGENGRVEFDMNLHPNLGMCSLYCKGSRFQDKSRMFGIVQDVSSRKAAEEASQRLAAIVESSDDAIISKE